MSQITSSTSEKIILGIDPGTRFLGYGLIKITKEKDFLYIDIEADSFLYNMVRNISGTLLDIGRGRFLKGSMRKILQSRNRRLAGPTLPAKGLCLMKVKY